MNDTAIAEPDKDAWADVLQWHFAVVGLEIGQNHFDIADGVSIRRIQHLPSPETIANCLSNPVAIGLFQHYAKLRMLRYELVIDLEYLEEDIPIPELADFIVTSIGVRTSSDLFCLAACERSWGQFTDSTSKTYLARIENAPYVTSLDEPIAITEDELHWVEENFASMLKLTEMSPFAIAFKSYSAQMHCPDPRMATTQIWAGIESLIQGRFQASYSLSLLTALLLEPKGPNCEKRRQAIRSMYDRRSDIVHGREVKDATLATHVVEARRLLAELLCKFIELGKIFDKKEIHKIATEVSDASELAPLTNNK